jgi:hypothetical protein
MNGLLARRVYASPGKQRRASHRAFCSTCAPRGRPRKTDTRFFPQVVTNHTAEAPLATIDKHRVEWWQKQQSNAFSGDGQLGRKARADSRHLESIPQAAFRILGNGSSLMIAFSCLTIRR